jgi:lysosomal acid lipase/cholesteryl ester hydrolase
VTNAGPASMGDKVFEIHTRRSGVLRSSLEKVRTGDGLEISVSRLERPGATDAVLLIHGLTTSSDMFAMPEHYGLAAYLHDQGFEVWLADCRMSNHYAYNQTSAFTFEDVAVEDWPAVVATIRRLSSTLRLHVVAHCLGSVTFHLALYGGAVTGISSVISNSVSLNPRVHPWAAFKLMAAPFMVERVLGLPYVDPHWAERDAREQPFIGRALARCIGLLHLECNDDACNLLSFVWGDGFPALFVHDKMSPVTHARLRDLFGPIAMPYFRNVRSGVLAGNVFVRYSKKAQHQRLPKRYIDNVGAVRVPTLFVSGDRNDIFPGANRLTFDLIQAKGVSGYHYRELPGYGHQDVFMGKECDREVFPLFREFLQNVIAS